MKQLLKLYNVSDEAIKIYLDGLGKFPFTFSEIHKILPKTSDDEINNKIDELVEKKLILVITSTYFDSLPHYFFLPPFAAIINVFSSLEKQDKPSHKESQPLIEKFQDYMFQDIENFSQDLIDIITSQAESKKSIEILSEVEKNMKNFAQVLLSEVNELIAKLKSRNIVNEIDIERVMRSVTQKISESEEIISNMFSQFRKIINEMEPADVSTQVESFKNFMTKLGDSIEKHSNEIFKNTIFHPLDNLEVVERSLYNILTDYISKNQDSFEKLWQINSLEKFREVFSLSLENTEKELTIIVPNIKDFIPLGKFELSYSEIVEPTPNLDKKLSKTTVPSRKEPVIGKEKKKEIEDKIKYTSKRVGDLKGYELSHDVAEILAKISEINPESLVIDNIQGWLNRLLVIRKYLDQNTQYLMLEDIEKWKADYLKIKRKEELDQVEKEIPESHKIEVKINDSEMNYKGFKLRIISSEPHTNKHVQAMNKKHIEYLRLKNNKIVALIRDNSMILFGVSEKTKKENQYDITGIITTFKPLIELIQPSISNVINSAKPTQEVQINKGFNEIINNINDYSGKKIAKKLNYLLDVAFEKDGISLNILEFKLLISKLEKIYSPLEDDVKEEVINELNKLNKEFSTLELTYPPEFRPSLLPEETRVEEIEEPREEYQNELLDPNKINTLFALFLEKIEGLKGVELGDQIDKFIDVILNLQGFSKIVKWKTSLSGVENFLDDPSKEQIKQDFLNWKQGILSQTPVSKEQILETSINPSDSQKDYLSGTEEEYISPGLAQTQFSTDHITSTFTDIREKTNNIDPKIKLKEEFERIEINFTELNGIDISKKMQNIVDIILETQGYSMDLKEIKDWVSRLKKIRQPLDGEIKEQFVLSFFKWKEKYSIVDSNDQSLSFGHSSDNSEALYTDLDINSRGGLANKLESMVLDTNSSTGNELSNKLQDISDIVLRSHGAVAANTIRQWISKLRTIRDLLEDELKEQFLEELGKWKEQFT